MLSSLLSPPSHDLDEVDYFSSPLPDDSPLFAICNSSSMPTIPTILFGDLPTTKTTLVIKPTPAHPASPSITDPPPFPLLTLEAIDVADPKPMLANPTRTDYDDRELANDLLS